MKKISDLINTCKLVLNPKKFSEFFVSETGCEFNSVPPANSSFDIETDNTDKESDDEENAALLLSLHLL